MLKTKNKNTQKRSVSPAGNAVGEDAKRQKKAKPQAVRAKRLKIKKNKRSVAKREKYDKYSLAQLHIWEKNNPETIKSLKKAQSLSKWIGKNPNYTIK